MLKAAAIALAVGLLVGAIYALLGVRSPAPPIVALVGLLGILIGEQVVSRLIPPSQPPPSSTGSDPP